MKSANLQSLPEAELRWALQSVLEELSLPALLCDGANVLIGNAAAQSLLARSGPEAEAAVSAAARGENNPLGLAVRAGPSNAGLLVLVAREDVDVRTRRSQAASARWSLTKRQAQVLSELILGRGNKDIAERLACSPKTIELHVSAILSAAGVASRAELLSLLLREA